jgi:predicted transcriptional regulator
MRERKIHISVRLNREHLAFLNGLAILLDRDRTYLVNQAVAAFIDHYKCQVDEMANAIAEAKKGEFFVD